MKNDINSIINKLTAYAIDHLLLDPFDQTYAFNRLCTMCGVETPKLDVDVDCGDATLSGLLDELKAAAPQIDKDAVADFLFPMPRTVNYYLEDKLARGISKGFDFLFDTYAHGYNVVSTAPAIGKDGYMCYSAGDINPAVGAALAVGGEQLFYTPIAVGNHIATLQNPDILSDDIARRLAAFVSRYGGAIATRVGDGSDYMCCTASALSEAKTEKVLSDGAVKIEILDYPVPALSFSGIARNSVVREMCKVIKSAAENNVPCVVAADGKNGVTLYVVFAGEIKADAFIYGGDALGACGVVRTKDCTPLLSVLEKGTALSTDLIDYKPIYDKIGGVKHGKDAINALGGALVDMYLPLLSAAASTSKEQAVAFVAVDK
ncbi:MAG: hypothetical protein J1F71_06405 [Clostridiales bacterium]|nr:hypothetical protein [Clostridiales bacterium]